MKKSYIGVIGMGVMGKSIALNILNNGYKASAFDIDYEKVNNAVAEAKSKGHILNGFEQIKGFIDSLERPRRIFIMVNAGKPVDMVIESILPYLEFNDLIIDGGNSYYKDTERRERTLKEKGILFIGAGISGGEKGALYGPSIMAGGSGKAWETCEEILTDIAAKADDNKSCCSHVGIGGAGHYVKMIHNSIEYGDMQLICEAYIILKEYLNLSYNKIAEIFETWNKGKLNSYLIEITSKILKVKDDKTGKNLVEVILDSAGQKGTGKWTASEAIDMGVCAPTLTDAVFVRFISSLKEQRINASKVLCFEGKKEINITVEDVENALYFAKVCTYAQGFDMLKNASKEYKWHLNYGDIALIWRKGCIIRAQFLNEISKAYNNNKELENILLDKYFSEHTVNTQESYRRVICAGIFKGIALPCFSSALSYFDLYRKDVLPINLLQAQRDYFGAHTYRRIDMEGTYHTQWE